MSEDSDSPGCLPPSPAGACPSPRAQATTSCGLGSRPRRCRGSVGVVGVTSSSSVPCYRSARARLRVPPTAPPPFPRRPPGKAVRCIILPAKWPNAAKRGHQGKRDSFVSVERRGTSPPRERSDVFLPAPKTDPSDLSFPRYRPINPGNSGMILRFAAGMSNAGSFDRSTQRTAATDCSFAIGSPAT